jgi:hypothetical protein
MQEIVSSWLDPMHHAARDALAQLYRNDFGLSTIDAENSGSALWDNRNRAANPAACIGDE